MTNITLYSVVFEEYCKIYGVNTIPNGLKMFLTNIRARRINYYAFMDYFDLKDEKEMLEFLLNDENREEIMRYSMQDVAGPIIWVENSRRKK